MARIRVCDNETTGLEPTDKVCELGWCDLTNKGGGWSIEGPFSRLHRVEVMPPQARSIHHISAEETWESQPFDPEAFWAWLAKDGVDVVVAHNAAYDLAYWGTARLPVVCTFKSARQLWPLEAPSHGNSALRYWLEDRGEIACDPVKAYPPHRAGPDAYVTANILRRMLSLTTANQMAAWTKAPLLQPRITFGKHKGEWADAPRDYLDWIMRSDMDADTKWNAKRELDRRAAA